MARIGIYLRISEDRDGNQTATERQEADCRKYAQGKGWVVVDVFKDIDLSAYKRGVKRPEFERMLEAVRAKEVDGVLAWKIDRITRRQRDLVRLDEACEESSGFIATMVDGIDTRQPTGRFVAELLVAQARMESENASIRIKRKHEEQAALGIPRTGGWRAFGYTSDRKNVEPAEADLIREAARRLLEGESVRSLCFDWEARGVRTPTGKAWGQHPLRRMVTSATLSGQREHRGRLTPGQWPSILTPEETTRLRSVLLDPGRRTTNGNPRRYLLTGILRCGNCSHRLVARPRDDGRRRYVCARQPNRPNCGKMARLSEPIEEAVTAMVIAALGDANLAKYLKSPKTGTAETTVAAIRADEEALEQLSRDHYANQLISRAEFFAARDAINVRVEANRRILQRSSATVVLAQVVGAGAAVAERWSTASLEWKRSVITSVIDHIVIKPAVRGRNTIDLSLIEPVWRY